MNMKFKFIKMISMLSLCAIALGCSQKDYTHKKELKLLVVGDSLSAAYDINPAKSWTEIIQKKFDEDSLNIALINMSTSGDTTQNALDKNDEHLSVHPDIVLMNIGANDALKNVNPDLTKNNLSEMITSFKNSDNKPDIIMVNIKPPYAISFMMPNVKKYTTIVPEISDIYKLEYIPDLFNNLDTSINNSKHFLADKVHPNENAQPIIADTIYKKLLPIIKNRHE